MIETGMPSPWASRRPARWIAPVLGAWLALLCALWLGSMSAAVAAPPRTAVEGVPLDVQDGDSLVFRGADGTRTRVRVAGIDAPEKTQPYAEASRRHLRALLRDQRIRIDPIKRDPYGRTVARVWILDPEQGPRDAALAQVEAGLAWHFTRYRADQTPAEFARYARAEQTARRVRAGLWRDDSPEAPWDFRARGRRDRAARAPSAPPRPER
jgi:endonuclease YncB( thermonuclease family)